jgi:hypothetical protein
MPISIVLSSCLVTTILIAGYGLALFVQVYMVKQNKLGGSDHVTTNNQQTTVWFRFWRVSYSPVRNPHLESRDRHAEQSQKDEAL